MPYFWSPQRAERCPAGRQKDDRRRYFFVTNDLREFVRTAVILTPAREASRVGTALRRQDSLDPEDPLNPLECSFVLEFETPIEVERSEARI